MKFTVRLRMVRYLETFRKGFRKLNDPVGKAAVAARIERAGKGNFGDYRQIDNGIGELRIDVGPGYRVYFGLHGDEVIVLVILGTKGSQGRDVSRALHIWNEFRKGEKT